MKSIREELNTIDIGDNVEFDIVGRFSIDYKTKSAQVLIDDWMFYKSDKISGFAFG